MKQLKDILFERLVLSKTKLITDKPEITLEDFMRWYATPEGNPPLDTNDVIDTITIETALEDNKDIPNTQLVRFYNKHKNDILIDLKEEIIKTSTSTTYRISFIVDNVYFTTDLSESFEDFIKKYNK